jgi:hypothetical protein
MNRLSHSSKKIILQNHEFSKLGVSVGFILKFDHIKTVIHHCLQIIIINHGGRRKVQLTIKVQDRRR